jgi:hypothetical protein
MRRRSWDLLPCLRTVTNIGDVHRVFTHVQTNTPELRFTTPFTSPTTSFSRSVDHL